MSLLDTLFGRVRVQDNGTVLPNRSYLDLSDGFNITDDPDNDRLIVKAVGTGGSFTGDVVKLGDDSLSVIKLRGATVPAAGALVLGTLLTATGVAALSYLPLDLSGAATSLTGKLAPANIAQAGATSNQVMTWSGSDWGPASIIVAPADIAQGGAAPGQVIAWNGTAYAPATIDTASIAAVPTSRTISTTAPLTGGGDLSANRTIAISNATNSTVGVVQLAGDLAGTGTSPIVVALTGASGSVPIRTPLLVWDNTVVNPELRHSQQTTNTVCTDFTLTSQAPFASATGTNRNPGNIVYVVPAPASGGTAGKHSFKVSGAEVARVVSIGVFATNANTDPSNSTGSPVLDLSNSSASGQAFLRYVINGTNRAQIRADFNGKLTIGTNGGPIAFANDIASAFYGQFSSAGLQVLDGAGSQVVKATIAAGTGKTRLGDASTPTDMLEVVGNIKIDSSVVSPFIKHNDTSGNGSALTIQAQNGGTNQTPGSIVIQSGQASATPTTFGDITIKQGTTTVLSWTGGNASTASPAVFGTGIQALSVSGGTVSSGGGSAVFVVGGSTTAAGQTAGPLTLGSGSPGSGGLRGTVSIVLGNTTASTMIRADEVASGRRVLALLQGNDTLATDMGTNTGDMVIFIRNAATDPTGNSANGGILYASGGALKWRGSSGSVTTLATA